MNPISATSLFHFTPKMNSFLGIIKNGFRFSYCCETYPTGINFNKINVNNPSLGIGLPPDIYKKGIAIPMISFCDIPLTRAHSHSKYYGKYIIGIEKNIAYQLYSIHKTLSISPILYIPNDDFKYSLLELSINEIKNNKEYSKAFLSLLGRCKDYDNNKEGVNYRCYYDEHEWRIFWNNADNTPSKWVWNVNESDKELISNLNKQLHNSSNAYIPNLKNNPASIIDKLITHLIVKDDSQIEKIVKYILNEQNPIFGIKEIPLSIRYKLISKITSYESIEKNF